METIKVETPCYGRYNINQEEFNKHQNSDKYKPILKKDANGNDIIPKTLQYTTIYFRIEKAMFEPEQSKFECEITYYNHSLGRYCSDTGPINSFKTKCINPAIDTHYKDLELAIGEKDGILIFAPALKVFGRTKSKKEQSIKYTFPKNTPIISTNAGFTAYGPLSARTTRFNGKLDVTKAYLDKTFSQPPIPNITASPNKEESEEDDGSDTSEHSMSESASSHTDRQLELEESDFANEEEPQQTKALHCIVSPEDNDIFSDGEYQIEQGGIDRLENDLNAATISADNIQYVAVQPPPITVDKEIRNEIDKLIAQPQKPRYKKHRDKDRSKMSENINNNHNNHTPDDTEITNSTPSVNKRKTIPSEETLQAGPPLVLFAPKKELPKRVPIDPKTLGWSISYEEEKSPTRKDKQTDLFIQVLGYQRERIPNTLATLSLCMEDDSTIVEICGFLPNRKIPEIRKPIFVVPTPTKYENQAEKEQTNTNQRMFVCVYAGTLDNEILESIGSDEIRQPVTQQVYEEKSTLTLPELLNIATYCHARGLHPPRLLLSRYFGGDPSLKDRINTIRRRLTIKEIEGIIKESLLEFKQNLSKLVRCDNETVWLIIRTKLAERFHAKKAVLSPRLAVMMRLYIHKRIFTYMTFKPLPPAPEESTTGNNTDKEYTDKEEPIINNPNILTIPKNTVDIMPLDDEKDGSQMTQPNDSQFESQTPIPHTTNPTPTDNPKMDLEGLTQDTLTQSDPITDVYEPEPIPETPFDCVVIKPTLEDWNRYVDEYVHPSEIDMSEYGKLSDDDEKSKRITRHQPPSKKEKKLKPTKENMHKLNARGLAAAASGWNNSTEIGDDFVGLKPTTTIRYARDMQSSANYDRITSDGKYQTLNNNKELAAKLRVNNLVIRAPLTAAQMEENAKSRK